MKVRSFYDEVYGSRIFLVTEVDAEKLARWVRREFKTHWDPTEKWMGKCFDLQTPSGSHAVVISMRSWSDTPFGVGVLAHEVFHAVEFVMDVRGIRHSEATTEPFAYLIQSYMERCLKLLGRK